MVWPHPESSPETSLNLVSSNLSGTSPVLEPSPPQLDLLEDLLRRDRNLESFELCRDLAPMESWTSTRALIVAGRLVDRWGDGPRGNRFHQKAYRENPADLVAIRYQGLAVWTKHGEFEALLFVAKQTKALPPIPTTEPEAYLWSLHARLLGCFRDFSTAEDIFEKVLSAFPRNPWLLVDQAAFLQRQDRYDEALATLEGANEIEPWYGPAVRSQAHVLQLLTRDDEAINLLRASLDHLQSGYAAQLLVVMLQENGHDAEIPALLDLVEKYLPTPDKQDRQWIAGRRCMIAHRAGDRGSALSWAKQHPSSYFQRIAQHLAKAEGPISRVHLKVGFVRQHHMTCAPATLAALSDYWGIASDHLEIARQICYDGSPDHIERDWAERNNWLVREFRPTWETTRALLDQGCPFAIVTVETESAHMQAVIGYDNTIGTVIVRDPYQRSFSEWLAPESLDTYAGHGPRAMLLLPPDKAHLIKDIQLDDTTLYDDYYEVRKSLHLHGRPTAQNAIEKLTAAAPEHLLTFWANYEVATYDGRQAAALEFVRKIRALHPKDNNWRLTELRLREQLEDQPAYRKLLHEIGAPRRALFALRREYAESLSEDARQHRQAHRVIRSLLRRQSTEPKNLHAYGNLLWKLRDFAAATFVYRLAACSGEKVEYHWSTYFRASRHLGDPAIVLDALRTRVTLWGDQSSLPARTLFDSLDALDKTEEALEVLETAMQRRPDDGEMILFAAEAFGRVGRHQRAIDLLESTSAQSRRYRWLLSAARIADFRRAHSESLGYWRELVDLNPAYTNGHAAVSRLLKVTEGNAASVQYLREKCAALPRLIALHELLVQQLRDEDPAESLAAIETMLELAPENAWALREKALILIDLRRFEDALLSAENALIVAPNDASSHGIKGDVLKARGETALAHESYRQAITRSIDADRVFSALINTSENFEAKVNAIAFIHAELLRQNSLDHACLKFREIARKIIPADELTAQLEFYYETNLNVWAAYSALSTHLLETGQHQRALEIAERATQNFPLTPRTWTDKAEIHAARHETAAQIEAIKKALEINPAWSRASRQLSQAYESQLDLDAAEHVLRRAIAATPLEAMNHGWLADILWRQSKPDEAIATIETAISLSPGYGWAWNKLGTWSEEIGEPNRDRVLSESLTKTRGGEQDIWIRLVRTRFSDLDPEENLKALDHAIQLDALNSDAWDLRAQILAKHRRYDEALAACNPDVYHQAAPHYLQGRAAYIEYQRGNDSLAIKQLQEIVEAHPDYLWGWSQLTSWYWEKKNWGQLKTAAEKWAWLDPETAIPHGYLATVHENGQHRDEHKQALATAIRLDPQYEFGVSELLGLHLKDAEFEAAENIIKHYETHYPAWEACRARVRFQIAKRDKPGATESVRAMAHQSTSAVPSFEKIIKLLFDEKWSLLVEEALTPLLLDETALPQVSEHWIEARRQRKRVWSTLLKLFRVKTTSAQRPVLLEFFISWLGTGQHAFILRFAARWWGQELRKYPNCWGIVSFSFTKNSLHHHTVRWMRDWRQRPTPPDPWMLHNLALSQYKTNRLDDMVAVLDYALTRPPDHVYEYLLAWRAFHFALSGEHESAQSLIAQINPTDWSNLYLSVLELSKIMVELQSTPAPERKVMSKQSISRLKAAVKAHPGLDTAHGLKNLHRRTMHRIGVDSQRWWLRFCSRLPRYE